MHETLQRPRDANKAVKHIHSRMFPQKKKKTMEKQHSVMQKPASFVALGIELFNKKNFYLNHVVTFLG